MKESFRFYKTDLYYRSEMIHLIILLSTMRKNRILRGLPCLERGKFRLQDEKIRRLEMNVANINKEVNKFISRSKFGRDFGVIGGVLGIVSLMCAIDAEAKLMYVAMGLGLIIMSLSAMHDYARMLYVSEFYRKFPVTVPDISQALLMWRDIEEDMPRTEKSRGRCEMIDQMLEFIDSDEKATSEGSEMN